MNNYNETYTIRKKIYPLQKQMYVKNVFKSHDKYIIND